MAQGLRNLKSKEVLALIFSFLFYGKVDLDIRGAVTIMSFLFFILIVVVVVYYLFL